MTVARLELLATTAAVLVALGVSGCGDDDRRPGAVTTPLAGDVWIYSSLRGAPLSEKDSMNKAMRLALDSAKARAGPYTVRWEELNRSASATGAWTDDQVAGDVAVAVKNPRTVGYIGEFASDASRTSLPNLNKAGISSISPASTDPGLTTNDDPGRPRRDLERNYPSGARTFVRLVPRDTVQAAALALTMKRGGCKIAAVAVDHSREGESLGRLIQKQARGSGVRLLAARSFTISTSARTLATSFAQQKANCFLLAAGTVNPAVARLYRAVASALGAKARLYGSSALCHQGADSPAQELPLAVAKRFWCMLPTLPATSATSQAAEQFGEAYRRRWGEPPTPYAAYAYEAMKLYIDTVRSLGQFGASREAVSFTLRAITERRSALGTYSVDVNGDLLPPVYGLYRVGRRNAPTFVGAVHPTLR